jgi:H+/Cl- antiporter ClcA
VGNEEAQPLVKSMPKMRIRDKPSLLRCLKSCFCFAIRDEPKRAAAAGAVAGIMVGIVGIFLPHTMFWGEAQLQNLIDKGRTPLPIFGEGAEPTAAFTRHAICMIDSEDAQAIRNGFSIGCSSLIAVAKTLVVGLSLGTGIIGGHFWGPLYVGCAASHFLTDVVNLLHDKFGFSTALSAYPCVVILCTMGSAHVGMFKKKMFAWRGISCYKRKF